VEPFDVAALSAATIEILTDSGLREEMGRAARALVEETFRREPALTRYESHYREVLA